MTRLHLTISSYEPLGSFRQDVMQNQVLPWRKARRLELSTAQPEWDAGSALHSAAISAKSSMENIVAELELKRQLAEVAQHAVSCQGLSVASVAQKMWFQQGLRGFVSKGEQLL